MRLEGALRKRERWLKGVRLHGAEAGTESVCRALAEQRAVGTVTTEQPGAGSSAQRQHVWS